jgi:hypothetical protein
MSWGGPRSLVLFVLATVILFGGGRRWLRSIRARRAADRLADPDASRAEILAAAEGGRAGLFRLFGLLAPEVDPSRRSAAGETLAILWKRDQLVAEEEKGIVTRGLVVSWHARRRYPRSMTTPIRVVVDFGVPFLGKSLESVAEENLEWSYRVKGANRLSLEAFCPWTPGPGRLEFTIAPEDFVGNGPHRLIFQARVRPRGLTSSWELDLPQTAMSFDFDPALLVESIQTQHDSAKAAAIESGVTVATSEAEGSVPFPLNGEFALRGAPILKLSGPLPSDLAHRIELELEGVPGRYERGAIVATAEGAVGPRAFAIGTGPPLPDGVVARTGACRMRAILSADPGLGWAEPNIRSLWPGTIETPWTDVTIVRV